MGMGMGMVNLLVETEEVLKSNNKTWNDVRLISDGEGEYTIEDFKRWANHRYDSGYGVEEVNPCLTISGDGWWLQRSEYDGSEWWDYCEAKVVEGDPIYHTTNNLFVGDRAKRIARIEKEQAQKGEQT